MNNAKKSNEQNISMGTVDRAESFNGNDLSSKNAVVDNFANFDAFSLTTSDSASFANIEFSSTQIDGQSILAKSSKSSSTNAKDRFLGNLSNNTSTKTSTLIHKTDEINNFKSLNNNFDRKFASFVTNNTLLTDKMENEATADTKEENFADFSNANVFKTLFEMTPELNLNKSKSKTDCDTTKIHMVPSTKFQSNYSKANDEFDQ